jgi:broad specificity phosphatase PhoE
LLNPSGNILVVAHNGVNRLYLAYKLGMPLKYYRRLVQDNSSVTLFSLDEAGEISLMRLNSKL